MVHNMTVGEKFRLPSEMSDTAPEQVYRHQISARTSYPQADAVPVHRIFGTMFSSPMDREEHYKLQLYLIEHLWSLKLLEGWD
jgi:hypothetical protein